MFGTTQNNSLWRLENVRPIQNGGLSSRWKYVVFIRG